jgi:hypothetical protein
MKYAALTLTLVASTSALFHKNRDNYNFGHSYYSNSEVKHSNPDYYYPQASKYNYGYPYYSAGNNHENHQDTSYYYPQASNFDYGNPYKNGY